VLNFIYYPVSWILWFWHEVFGFVFGPSTGVAWAFAVVFLVFTLRALLYKPFVHQVRSMRKMQEFAPEIQKLKKKYGNDKQKMAVEMQKLQGEHGVNPIGGCLPVLVQVPVFIGLFHVLRSFGPFINLPGGVRIPRTENYVFDQAGVDSFNRASIFGAKLGAAIHPYAGGPSLADYQVEWMAQLIPTIPLAIAAAIFTHITARHSIARQTEAQAANPQAAMMNKLMLWLFPIGAVAGSPFLPLAILVYWVANNLWTLGQQRVVYGAIDKEEAEAKAKKTEARANLAPKVGQKPVVGQKPAVELKQKKPGAKPIAPRSGKNGAGNQKPSGSTNGNGSTPVSGTASGDPGSNGGGSPTPGRGRKR
jgi:YidC/Oxa1 family membrane protein insertase